MLSRIVWMVGQAATVGFLLWLYATGPQENAPPLGMFFAMSVVMVAFGTAVIVNLYDWIVRKIRGLPASDRQASKRRPARKFFELPLATKRQGDLLRPPVSPLLPVARRPRP